MINGNYKFEKSLKRAEDHVFFLSILKECPNIKYIDEHLYNYRKSNASAVNKYSENVEENFINTLTQIKTLVYDIDDDFKKAYYARSVFYIFTVLKNDYFHKDNKNSFFYKVKNARKMLKRDIFKEAIANVDKKTLNKKQRSLFIFIKFKLIILLYFIYKFSNSIKNKNYNK